MTHEILAVEGMDASGKMTQTKLLAERLRGTRFPFPEYATPVGQAILGHLKREWYAADVRRIEPFVSHSDPLIFQCLQTVNRLEMLPAIELALKSGPVIFDRYYASAFVYGGLEGLDREWLARTQERPMPQPDHWFYIDISNEESVRRRPERRDRYESQPGFMAKVRAGYLRLFEERQRLYPESQNWHIIDGMGTVEEVHARIMEKLR